MGRNKERNAELRADPTDTDSWETTEVHEAIQPGRLVKVRSGVLEGMEGLVVRRVQGSRLLVALPCLQQGIFIQIEESLLEPI